MDDVGAIAFLCDAVHRHKLDLIGISVNVKGDGEAAAADALLERFGVPQLPICVWNGELLQGGNQSDYVDYLSTVLSKERAAKLRAKEPVEFAVYGESDYYALSPQGTAFVTPDSDCSFTEDANGRHSYVKLKKSPEETGKHISDELLRICRKG